MSTFTRQTSRYPAMLLLVLAACGCGHSPTSDGVVSNESIADRGSTDAPSQLTQSSPAEPTDPTWSLGQRDLLPPDDPAADGWQTEAFTLAANEQLKLLGEWIVGHSPSPTPELADLVAAEFVSDPWLPHELPVVHESATFKVQRMRRSENRAHKARRLANLADALDPLRRWMSAQEKLRCKFKLFRVEMTEHGIETQQYFHLSGRTSQGAREQNATWRIIWTPANSANRPRIRSIEVTDLEQVSTTVNGGVLLTDCTYSTLANNSSYADALLPGIHHWRDRLEHQVGVYNPGHHGLSLGDVNGDGLDDLYVCQTGGIPNHLYLQQADGSLRDVSAAANVDYLDNTRSALFVDLDNDNDQDLILALTTGLLLLENHSSRGSPEFRLRARIPSVRQAFSLASADYDHDGWLDLYVCVYYGDKNEVAELPLPLPYFDATNGGSNFLIRNHGGWRFENVTDHVGLADDNHRFSLAAAWEDYDNDGDVDLMVINDFGPNQLYRNDGHGFKNVAEEAGLLDGAFGMSATFADFDHNQWMDLYVSNMFSAAGNRITYQPQFKAALSAGEKARFQYLARGNSLFRSAGHGRFDDVSVSHRVTMGRWSWGSLFADLDNDSWDDLLVANGYLTGESVDDL